MSSVHASSVLTVMKTAIERVYAVIAGFSGSLLFFVCKRLLHSHYLSHYTAGFIEEKHHVMAQITTVKRREYCTSANLFW